MITAALATIVLVQFLVIGYLAGRRWRSPVLNAIARRALTPRAAPPPLPRHESTDTQDRRFAVHEAGHAVAAWCCTNVTRIMSITINPDEIQHLGGRCSYEHRYRFDRLAQRYWCELVISIAGMAAEVAVYGKVRSGPSEKDLLDCLGLANELIDLQMPTPPWQWPLGPQTLAFAQMYERASEEAVAVIATAYQAARLVVDAHGPRFYHLVDELTRKRTLSEANVEGVLGSRAITKAIGMYVDPNFTLPRTSSRSAKPIADPAPKRAS